MRLSEWRSFFSAVGTSAGALTGLMFVVMALYQGRTSAGSGVARSYATPTIVHFTTVLSLAALLSMPGWSFVAAGVFLMVISAALLGYVSWALRNSMRQAHVYRPDLEDRIWHFVLPFVAYGSMLVSGVLFIAEPSTGPYVLGSSLIGLLVIGIHNAWDSAVWQVMRRSDSS